jgi:hypothetical protein
MKHVLRSYIIAMLPTRRLKKRKLIKAGIIVIIMPCVIDSVREKTREQKRTQDSKDLFE